MRILIDFSYIEISHPTGVSIFGLRLLSGIINTGNNDVFLLVNQDAVPYFRHTFPNCNFIIVNNSLKNSILKYLYVKNRILNLIKSVINKKKIDLFFIPYLTIWSIIPYGCCVVSVIHDLQPLKLNSKLKNLFYKIVLYKKINETSHLVTISNYCKCELLKTFKLQPYKISVIYNSVVFKNNDNNVNLGNLPIAEMQYILNVNALEPYKNQLTILKAFDLIKNKCSHMLVFKSKKTPYWNSMLYPEIINRGLKNRVILIDQNLSSTELKSLYTGAAVFVNSSLMEGFGFTPIEAAICEVPVITSKCAALYETTLGLLNYIDNPKDEFEIAKMLLHFITNPPEKDKLSYISNQFITEFSVNKQAKKYLNLFSRQIVV